ncbi:unnamed protein product [Triticum turgidum subsp. durum]|uniref:non-specific serine/threonine protein kinase n=1 Tax=Triticum turgidum subsp. durum TaxID=4567 RepID=A0A9R1QJV9_TRITD|nr:unnamed protein product [Triticum turgidum subsp. durum]
MAVKPLHLLFYSTLVMLVSLQLQASSAQTNITSRFPLLAAAGAGWSSPSGRFSFGFYATDGGLAIGVWLATAPNITVTWTANRNNTPDTGGSLRLTYDGRLIWIGASIQDRPVAVPPRPAVSGAMLDDGNFVLYGADASVVWSTFASPTDTLLAGQDLVPGAQLFSSVSDTNRATGKYRLTNQQNDANLVLYPVGTSNVADAAYWSTVTFQIGFLLTLRLDASGVLYQANSNGSFTSNLTRSGSAKAGAEAYYRLTLDPDGVLRLYHHAFVSGGASKASVQWSTPSDRCLVKGVCGLNSYCVLDHDGQPSCLCPPGFGFLDATNTALGCTVNSSAGECRGGQQDAASFSMAPTLNMSWVNAAYEVMGAGTSAADCQAACLSDCFCAAVLRDANDGTCTKQQLPLRYGRVGGAYTLSVKTGGAANPASGGGGSGRDTRNKPVGVGRATTIALVCIGILACVALSAFIASARLLRVKRQHVALANADAGEGLEEETAPLRSYTYQELERATHCFRDPLGRGAFGTVFKGALRDGEKAIAVKRLEKLVEDGEREFQREVCAIGRTSHRNLVRLLGFCHEGANRLLVYEFMSNGSVADLLFKGGAPAWPDRLGIALDVARGLHYLHDELDSRVIHCDVKPQNILIDAAGKAKIADFGLAKLLQPDQTRTFTGVRGTRGYLAPEWYRGAGPVTVKADVYSYGVVLLEIVTCRRSMEMEEAGEERTLMELVYECLLRGEVTRAMSSDEVVDAAAVERAVKVGIWCVQGEPESRPSIKSVILMLEGHLEVPFPPPPAS